MSNDKFFFEEDPEGAKDSGITWEEHTDTFMNVLKDGGFIKEGIEAFSLDTPLTAQADVSNTKKVRNVFVEIEYGIIQSNYAVHITPIHAQKNLTKQTLLNLAIKQAVFILNQHIPPSVRVEIFMPRPDYEIKAISFVVKEGAEAWNLDTAKIEIEAIPKLLEEIAKICMQA